MGPRPSRVRPPDPGGPALHHRQVVDRRIPAPAGDRHEPHAAPQHRLPPAPARRTRRGPRPVLRAGLAARPGQLPPRPADPDPRRDHHHQPARSGRQLRAAADAEPLRAPRGRTGPRPLAQLQPQRDRHRIPAASPRPTATVDRLPERVPHRLPVHRLRHLRCPAPAREARAQRRGQRRTVARAAPRGHERRPGDVQRRHEPGAPRGPGRLGSPPPPRLDPHRPGRPGRGHLGHQPRRDDRRAHRHARRRPGLRHRRGPRTRPGPRHAPQRRGHVAAVLRAVGPVVEQPRTGHQRGVTTGDRPDRPGGQPLRLRRPRRPVGPTRQRRRPDRALGRPPRVLVPRQSPVVRSRTCGACLPRRRPWRRLAA